MTTHSLGCGFPQLDAPRGGDLSSPLQGIYLSFQGDVMLFNSFLPPIVPLGNKTKVIAIFFFFFSSFYTGAQGAVMFQGRECIVFAKMK